MGEKRLEGYTTGEIGGHFSLSPGSGLAPPPFLDSFPQTNSFYRDSFLPPGSKCSKCSHSPIAPPPAASFEFHLLWPQPLGCSRLIPQSEPLRFWHLSPTFPLPGPAPPCSSRSSQSPSLGHASPHSHAPQPSSLLLRLAPPTRPCGLETFIRFLLGPTHAHPECRQFRRPAGRGSRTGSAGGGDGERE